MVPSMDPRAGIASLRKVLMESDLARVKRERDHLAFELENVEQDREKRAKDRQVRRRG